MKKTIALVLGGGAPNLTLMAGAVAALDDAGVKFDVVSTSGAGMLIGLLYAAPKGSSGDIKRTRSGAQEHRQYGRARRYLSLFPGEF